MKPFYLYKIVNSINDKIYIGLTARPKERMREHLTRTSKCSKLRKAMDKHGRENFSMEILCVGTEEYTLELEMKAMRLYDCVKNGYNILSGHPNQLGVSIPEETKKAMSESLLKFYRDNPNYLKENRKPRQPKQEPQYVTGFWFPSKLVALISLQMNEKSFYKWRKESTLGEVCHPQSKSVSHRPIYISGFWFDSLIDASVILKISKSKLLRMVYKDDVEAKLNSIDSKPRKKDSIASIGVNQRENGNFRAVLFYKNERLLSKTFTTELQASLAYDDCYEEIHGNRPNKTIREDSQNNTEAIN